MSDARDHYCPRCDDAVRAIRPWPWWNLLWNAWKVGFALILCLMPFLASDYCVMLPSTMLFLASGGLLRGYAKQKPVCRTCSLELDPASKQGTQIRAIRPS